MRLEAAIISGIFFTTSVLVSSVHGFDLSAHHHRHRRHAHAHLHDRLRRDATRTVNELGKRNDVFGAPNGLWPTVVVPAGFTLAAGVQLTPLPDMAVASVTGSAALANAVATAAPVADPAQWNVEAERKCMDAVVNLKGKSTNPSGIAVCYNLPYYDKGKGIFEAELRMYNISMPTDSFVGVTPEMMLVTLSYSGATIQKSDGTLPVKRDAGSVVRLERRQSEGVLMPQEIAIRKYIGQLNKGLMDPGKTMNDMQPFLIPQISISAVNPNTQQNVNTSLSSTEASFVAGVFSRAAGSNSDPKALLGRPVDQLAAAAAGQPTPFVVPGLYLGVFPTGLIITCIWLMAFMGAVGYGTYMRIQFREEYRKEIKYKTEVGVRRF